MTDTPAPEGLTLYRELCAARAQIVILEAELRARPALSDERLTRLAHGWLKQRRQALVAEDLIEFVYAVLSEQEQPK